MPNLTTVGNTLENPRWNAGNGGLVKVSCTDGKIFDIGAGLCHVLSKIPGCGLDLREVNAWTVEHKLILVSAETLPGWLDELRNLGLVEKTGKNYFRTDNADNAQYMLKPLAPY